MFLPLSFPSGIPIMCVYWSSWWFPTSSLNSLHSISFSFLFAPLEELHCPVFKFTDPFSMLSGLLLNAYVEFFSSITIFFSFMISVYIYCLFFLEFSFCSYIALLTLVSIFMTIILNSLSGKSSLGLISGDLACSFRTHFPVSSFLLTYCIGIFTTEKTTTSFSLHRLASNRRRSLLISPTRDLG